MNRLESHNFRSCPPRLRQPRPRRALTLLEMMLAVVLTAMVGAAMAGMLHAVSVGVDTRRDNRSLMVHAGVAQARLGAYIAPARCVLAASDGDLVLWFDDARQSGTVHASEVRWLLLDPVDGVIEVMYVSFPSAWTATQQYAADRAFAANTDWEAVRLYYAGNGWLASETIIDGLADAEVTLDAIDPLESRHVSYRLQFESPSVDLETIVSGTVRRHRPPVN